MKFIIIFQYCVNNTSILCSKLCKNYIKIINKLYHSYNCLKIVQVKHELHKFLQVMLNHICVIIFILKQTFVAFNINMYISLQNTDKNIDGCIIH